MTDAALLVLADFVLPDSPLSGMILAITLFVGAMVLLVLEILIVSFGVLGIAAVGCAAASVVVAFDVHPAAGWIFLLTAPVAAVVIGRWGLKRLQTSSLVPQDAIAGDAGVRGLADRLGIDVGSTGVLVTDAYPGGRARFPGGVCDVHVQGGALDAGTAIVVRRIDGPTITVTAHSDHPASP